MKTEFLRVVNHQLRTPVTIIKGMLSMMAEGTIKGKKLKQYIQKSYLSSERLTTILDDILVAQGLVGKGQPVNLAPCQIEEIVEKTVEHLQTQAKAKGLKLFFEKAKRPLPVCLLDREMMERVVSRLVDNAILYTEKGEVKVSMTLKKDKDKDYAQISVKDSGIGITREDKPFLFRLFGRGKRATGLHANGSGLGLFIVKEYVEAHQGRIQTQSQGKDKGTTFIIILPIITEV